MKMIVRWLVIPFLIATAGCGQVKEKRYPKLAPYDTIRWENAQPIVKLEEQWFRLKSIDGVDLEKIIAFSQRIHGDLWRKRFEEDLVELLSKMGHELDDSVDLVVLPIESSEERTFKNVSMTRRNRQAIWDAARERREIELVTREAVPINDRELFRTRIDEFLKTARDKTGFSGVVIVGLEGEPIYGGTCGFSHLHTKTPNTLDTPFRIASLSKQFTAAAILRLEADGKLNINHAVGQYLPRFGKPPYDDITIHHLLTHTSGLPRTGGLKWRAMSRAPTPASDYVDLAVSMPLRFKPGTDYQYSNFGYRILSELITQVTTQPYADYMENEIFHPLGMKNTGVARVQRPPSEKKIAEGLSLKNFDTTGKPVFVHGENGRNFGTGYGSGGIHSSANDLLTWDQVLRNDHFLSEEQKSKLFQPIHQFYACGWVVKRSGLDGRLYHSHSGANEGFFSRMMRLPEEKRAIIALGNVDSTAKIDQVVDQLFRLCRSLPYRDTF